MKTWKTPKLIVLVRSNAEESILFACKRSTGGSSSQHTAGNCYQGSGPGSPCNSCQLQTSS